MDTPIRIIIIDDEDDFLFMTQKALEQAGFEVRVAEGGERGLALMREDQPDVVLLDLNMPEPDGHQVCDIIKNDPRLGLLPVIILTASDDISDKLKRLDGGADDYITKFADSRELEARIRSVVRRHRQNLDCNPLTRLPGNTIIQKRILQLLQSREKFAVAYTDLDNFKAFNDKYGFQKGDEVILFSARVLKESCGQQDFIGHVGGDDFVIISTPDKMTDIARKVTSSLDQGITKYYDDSDREAGYVITRDRKGKKQKYPFVSISIAVATNSHREFASIGEIVEVVTELKKFAKQKEGSCVVFDKRAE
jgi:diguanylate cyclase (GGDEF)-like protein